MEEASYTRFRMSKERHYKSLEKAECENKVDKQLIGLCKWFRESEHYFTSSGCAGRVVLLELVKDNNKLDTNLHRKWHREVTVEEIIEGIETETEGELWLKLDPFILHIGCPTLENAKDLLSLMNKAGIKRGGIFSVKEGRYLVELIGSHTMSIPVKSGSKILVEPEYISYAVKRTNEKLALNYEKLSQLEKVVKGQLTP